MLRAIDICCSAGGVAKGLQMAGFRTLGVDIRPQPRFVGDWFVQADMRDLTPEYLSQFDFGWASPPCQKYSDITPAHTRDSHPELIEPARALFKEAGIPYVIENVEGAPLINPVTLCGTMFPGLRVLRHRLFEASFPILTPPHGRHPLVHTLDKRKAHYGKTDDMRDFVQVTGGGNSSKAAAADAMGIDWMTKEELNEAIPPAYAHFIAKTFLAQRKQAA